MKNKIILFALLFVVAFNTTNLLAEDVLLSDNPPAEVPLLVETVTEIPADPIPPVDEEEKEVPEVDETKTEDPEIVPEGTSEPFMVMSLSVEPEAKQEIRLIVKKNSQTVFDQNVEISGEVINFDASGENKSIAKNTALGAMLYADGQSGSFEFTDIDYYSAYESYLINCLNVPSIQETDLCYDWQYVVNGEYPAFGADKYVLNTGDVVYFYFGKSKKITVPDSILINQEFSVTAETYDYINDAWNKLQNKVLGVIKMEGWNATEIATSTTDSEGLAMFTLTNEDSYQVGFQEDYYYPSYNLVFGTTTVSVATSTATTTATSTDEGVGGSGGSGSSSKTFNITKAIEFLIEKQKTNGSFGADLYTDWVAVAFGAKGESNSTLKNFIKNDSVSSELMEYLRRSMALMALGLNPQTGYKEDLIQKILAEYNDEQFGDSDLFNDDIFAVLVLANMGFDYDDDRIKNSVDFIIDAQSGDGSWEGVDLTAASVQALENYSGEGDVDESLQKAKNYLATAKENDGSWNGNVYSTAWAMNGVSALGENPESFGNDGDPLEYLGSEQDADGGLLVDDSEDNRVWSTAYAISAASGSDWNDILNDFNYVVPKNDNKDGGSSSDNSPVESATTTTSSSEDVVASDESVDENLDVDVSQSEKLFVGQNSIYETEGEAGAGDSEPGATTTDSSDENNLQASAINSTTKINYWYLAGGILFALIALRIFRK